MEYPKAIMTMSELEKMGFTKEQLRKFAYSKLNEKYGFAFRTKPNTGHWRFDTVEFEKRRHFLCRP